MNKSNCPICEAKRSVWKKKQTTYHQCDICKEKFYMSTRKHRAFPDIKTKNIIKNTNEFRRAKVYEVTKSVLPTSERENVRDTMDGKLLCFRHGGSNWNLKLVSNVYVDLTNEEGTFSIKTDIDINEYENININEDAVLDVEKSKLQIQKTKVNVFINKHNKKKLYKILKDKKTTKLTFNISEFFLKDEVWFEGNLITGIDEDGKRDKHTISMPTDVSIEEYKNIKNIDEKFDRKVSLSSSYPYNLYVTLFRNSKLRKINNKVEIGVDLNFPILVAAVKINGEEPFFFETPFPENKIRKLHERANIEVSKGNLPKKSMFQNTAKRISKGTYYRFIEHVHKEVRNKLKLKSNKNIKFIWKIEAPFVLRKLNSQFMKQGWKPTLLKLCLEEKRKFMYLEIVEVSPANTSAGCNKCGKIHKSRTKKIMTCDCGEVICWHRNAALNLLSASKKYCSKCKKYTIVMAKTETCYKCGGVLEQSK